MVPTKNLKIPCRPKRAPLMPGMALRKGPHSARGTFDASLVAIPRTLSYMADDDVLEQLRENRHWPRRGRLDALAVKGAAIGQLRAARDWAEELTNEQLVHNPDSSATILPAEVPIGEYSHLPDRLATFYTHLETELRKVVGPLSLTVDGRD